MHSGQLKPNLRCKRQMLSGLEGLLEVVGLEVTAKGGGWYIWRSGGREFQIAVAATLSCVCK